MESQIQIQRKLFKMIVHWWTDEQLCQWLHMTNQNTPGYKIVRDEVLLRLKQKGDAS
jgi:hypothetical protein